MSKRQRSSPQQPSFHYLLCETMRVLSTHRRHFLILFLFFFLLRFLAGTAGYSQSAVLRPKSPTTASVILTVMHETLSFTLSLLAIGTITFSSYNFLLGRPIKVISIIHSLLRSFPSLLITSITSLFIKYLVTFAFAPLAVVIMKVEILWFKIDQSSLRVTGINTAFFWIETMVVFYLTIIWALSHVVVLVESKWGFQPLRRSIQLMKGKKRALVLVALFSEVISWSLWYFMKQANGDSKSFKFVLSIAMNTGVSTVLMMVNNVASTVLYFKAVQGDVTGEYNTALAILVDDDENNHNRRSLRPTFYYLLCEIIVIVSSNRHHFLILTLLFLLPQSLFGTIYSEWSLLHPKSPTAVSIILSVIYETLSFIISLLAIGPILFSSYNFLLARPTKLILSIHSLSRSFPRLLITSLPYLFIKFLVLFASWLRAGLIMVIEVVWFKIDQSSLYFTLINEIVTLIGMTAIFYLEINWALSSVIVVVESKRGFEPLRRSIQLMQGMRRALVSLAIFNETISWCLAYGFSYLIKQDNNDSKTLLFVLRIAVDTSISMVSMLVYDVATVVLYGKAMQGEVTGKYVSLPLVNDDDDEKTCKINSHVMPSFGMA